jgi:hypothetical protein
VLKGQGGAHAYFERLRQGVEGRKLAEDPTTLRFSAVLTVMMSLGWLTCRDVPRWNVPALERNFGVLDAWCDDETLEPVNRLGQAHVAIVGLGGVGSEIALHLAAAGLGRLTLVDGDKVESSNLNRQYAYSRCDIGRPKSEALATRLRDLRPDIDARCFGTRICVPGDLNNLEGADLVVQAADDLSIPLDAWVAGWADARGTGFIAASLGIDMGYWGPLAFPQLTPPAATLLGRLMDTVGDGMNLRRQTRWSLGATNSLIAAFTARDIIAVLAGANDAPSLGRRMRIRFSTGSVDALDLRI